MTMSTADRQVVVSIMADVSGLRAGLSQVQTMLNNTQKTVNQTGSTIGTMFQMMGTMLALKGINAITNSLTNSINTFGVYQANMQKFGTVWTTEAQSMIDWANKVSLATGLTKNELIQASNNFGDLMVGIGVSEKSAAGMSQSLTQLAYDLASANAGTVTTQDAIRDLQSAMMGEAQAGKVLGLNLKENQLQLTAYNMGLKGNYQSLDEGTKMMVIYNAIMEQSKISYDFLANSAETVKGAQIRLNSAWQNTSAYLGEKLAPMFTVIVNILMNSVFPAIMFVGQALGVFFTSVANGGAGLYILIGVLALLAGIITYVTYGFVASAVAQIASIFGVIGATLAQAGAEVLKTGCMLAGIKVALLAIMTNGALVASLLVVIAIVILLASVFKNSMAKLKKSLAPPKMNSYKDILKNMNKMPSAMKKNTKTQKTEADKQADVEKKLNAELKKQFNDRMKAFMNVANFMEGVQRKILGAGNIIKAAKSSVNAIKDFNNAIDVLKKRLQGNPMSETFLTELRQLDPQQYADYVQSLANATDMQLQEIVQLWGERHKEAVKAATDQIEAAKPEIQKSIEENLSISQDSIDALGDTIGASVSDAIANGFANQQLNLGDSLDSSFEDTLDGLIEDITNSPFGKKVYGALTGGMLTAFGGMPKFMSENVLQPLVKAMTDGLTITDLTETGKTVMDKIATAMAGVQLGGIPKLIIKTLTDGFSGNELTDAGSKLASKFKDGLTGFNFGGVATSVSTLLTNGFSGVSLSSVGTRLADSLASGLNSIKTTASNISETIKTTLLGAAHKMIDALNSMIDGINNKLTFTIPWWVPYYGGQSWYPNLKHIPQFANGGVVDKATLGVFGEAGAEALIPLSSMQKMAPFAEAIAKYMGTNGGSSINVYGMTVREEADITKISQKLFDLQRQDQRRLGFGGV